MKVKNAKKWCTGRFCCWHASTLLSSRTELHHSPGLHGYFRNNGTAVGVSVPSGVYRGCNVPGHCTVDCKVLPLVLVRAPRLLLMLNADFGSVIGRGSSRPGFLSHRGTLTPPMPLPLPSLPAPAPSPPPSPPMLLALLKVPPPLKLVSPPL